MASHTVNWGILHCCQFEVINNKLRVTNNVLKKIKVFPLRSFNWEWAQIWILYIILPCLSSFISVVWIWLCVCLINISESAPVCLCLILWIFLPLTMMFSFFTEQKKHKWGRNKGYCTEIAAFSQWIRFSPDKQTNEHYQTIFECCIQHLWWIFLMRPILAIFSLKQMIVITHMKTHMHYSELRAQKSA